MPVEFGILGPLEVTRDGRVVELGATKQRALLALLLMHANRVVSIDRLVDDLWGPEAPARATNAVQVYVSALRRVLEPDRPTRGTPGLLLTRAPGYLLQIDAEQLDLLRFERLVEDGRQAMEAGDGAGAGTAFAEALSLWRGPALADFAYEPFAEREAARLEELHLRATEERVEADLAVGRHADLVGELDGLVGAAPMRERLTAQLMLALYRCGRQAEALRAYQKLRSVLGEELGIEPSAALQALEEAILLQKPDLDWAPENGASRLDTPLPTGVVTFLLTDIENSSGLWERHPEAMAEALARHDALAGRVVAERGGELIKAKGEGDATLSVFTRASDGVRAAVDLQNALAVEEWPDGIDMRVRMALHTGEAHERDGDYYGPTVNRAARLRSLADGGQTVVSQATAEVVLDRLPRGATLVDVGSKTLRGLARPEHVFELAGLDAVALGDAAPAILPIAIQPGLGRDDAGFAGRQPELEELANAWQRATAGQRQVALLAGEPGIGKTPTSSMAVATRTWASRTSPSSKPCATMSTTRPTRCWRPT
jgi:DNA-binding SARP family transcriptional activator